MKIKAVINDIDGNLVLSEETCWHLENEVFAAMHLPAIDRTLHRKTWGMKLADALPIRSNGKADQETFWNLFTDGYAAYVAAGKLDAISPENLDALRELQHMGLVNMLLTSRIEAELVHFMQPDHALADLVDAFYYQDNMQYHKPDPRAFAHIEEEHGLRPSECVYVGDQPGDAAAAKGAGLHFIANLEEGLRTREDFADYPVDAFIEKFAELPDAIRKLEAQLSSQSIVQ